VVSRYAYFLFVLLGRLDKIQLIIQHLSFGSQTKSFIRLVLFEFTKQNSYTLMKKGGKEKKKN
jgi:hypothetical protein